jgi:hypothetical protein
MAKLTKLSLAHQTMFADLIERAMDASFDEQFPENGSFLQVTSKGRSYWYYSGYKPTGGEDGGALRDRKYVGPVDDPAVTSRVHRFGVMKESFKERRQMVQSLTAVGLPSPVGFVGNVTEALWKAGLFRLRGVLIGTLAFQAYGGLLGVRIPGAPLMTADADFAQFHSISTAVDDQMPPILDVLSALDSSFTPVPHVGSRMLSTKYRNSKGFMVEFLTPNRGSDDNQGRPAVMDALGGSGAEPIRYLDFLIHNPVRSVLLHKGGIPVNIPSPERYAIHKLIVSTHRKPDGNGRLKRQKDLVQSGMLFQALEMEGRLTDVGLAWMEAWARGPRWQEGLRVGAQSLDQRAFALLHTAVDRACREEKQSIQAFGLPSQADEPFISGTVG